MNIFLVLEIKLFSIIFYNIEYISDMTYCSQRKVTGWIPVVWASAARMMGIQVQALPLICF